jgi:hypothetical protein
VIESEPPVEPCRQYLQCYDQCRHYNRTAHPEEQRRLEDLRAKMQRALDIMRQNAAGEAGSDKWVSMMEAKLANLGASARDGSTITSICARAGLPARCGSRADGTEEERPIGAKIWRESRDEPGDDRFGAKR